MEIVQAHVKNFVEVIYLMNVSIDDMVKNGIHQWKDSYPTLERVQAEIESGDLYIMKEKGISVGAITFNQTLAPAFEKIDWDDKSGNHIIIHRIVVYPTWQNKGIARKLVEFASQQAKEKGCASVKLDVISTNDLINKFIQKLDFEKRGTISFAEQDISFNCFEKKI